MGKGGTEKIVPAIAKNKRGPGRNSATIQRREMVFAPSRTHAPERKKKVSEHEDLKLSRKALEKEERRRVQGMGTKGKEEEGGRRKKKKKNRTAKRKGVRVVGKQWKKKKAGVGGKLMAQKETKREVQTS